MIEIRPIVQSEGERFLHVLCDVFELDYYRAEGIFFTEPLFDLSRKWALFENGEIVSILTTVPLEFGWGRAFGVAGVATLPNQRNRGLAAKLLNHVCEAGNQNGEGAALLFAKEPGVYARCAFETLDRTIRGTILGVPEERNPKILSGDEVRVLYDHWASQDHNRLRRDERRWQYWRWNLRVCSAIPDGYLCLEGDTMREAITPAARADWPVGRHSEWLGLASMARNLGLPLEGVEPDLYFMGRNVPSLPQMFLTDQF